MGYLHEDGTKKVFNELNQHIGFIGEWEFHYTNSALVGATTASDNSWYFLDPSVGSGGTDPVPNGYTLGEEVILDATASQSYDLYFIAIIEQGPTYNRYKSTGWTNGTITTFSLTNLWKETDQSWEFELNHQYKVQFAIENNQCTNNPWNNNDDTFFMCPLSTECRFGQNKEIEISPNPANNFINIKNINYDDMSDEIILTMTDITGKQIIKTKNISTPIDISSYENGMYIINIYKNGNRIKTSKLIVN